MTNRLVFANKFLRIINDFQEPPRDIVKGLHQQSEREDIEPTITVRELFGWLQPPIESSVRELFGLIINKWDYLQDDAWTEHTDPNTAARRSKIYEELNLSKEYQLVLDTLFPISPPVKQAIRITDFPHTDIEQSHAGLTDNYYWRCYEEYLRDIKKWTSKNIAVLHNTSAEIVSYLAEPTSYSAKQGRGLVVGYVQSGKTANFTGVIAKAIDKGFRLIVVLAGTQNTLRNQTQRRIDKELVGRDDPRVQEEYSHDDDWNQFLSHNGRPSESGHPDIFRLTTSQNDFMKTPGVSESMVFQKKNRALPLSAPENLSTTPAILIVIKKNKTTLSNLETTLVRARKQGVAWNELPSLVIDDESDQASLNTNKKEKIARSEINRLIVSILRELGRAQYIGYTATPFANVFVDPEDAEDLFPSDFIISLPRPEGYMGVGDFYEFGENSEVILSTDPRTKSGAHVRPVIGSDDEETNLQEAIDAFVLSGALKLYRESIDPDVYGFRHHTMLVHIETRMETHGRLHQQVSELFLQSGYATGGPGLKRLRSLWDSDFEPVCQAQNLGWPFPAKFEDIIKHIGPCVQRVLSHGGSPAKILNSASDEPPDFDKTSVWQIIVGGAKLARGYTVEGLTISYYRRITRAADTLMQMGRWFGYRSHYKDLVRLYIGTEEPLSKKGDKKLNLYDAFGALCKDEEEFRQELEKYSQLAGDERLTPRNIPPLVPSHLLPPTSKNKMYNARITFMNFGGQIKNPTFLPKEESQINSNYVAWRRLIETAHPNEVSFAATNLKGAYLVGIAQKADFEFFMKTYRQFDATKENSPEWLRFVAYISEKHGNPEIDRWVIIQPLISRQSADKTTFLGNHRISHVKRERDASESGDDSRIKTLIDPTHRRLAVRTAGLEIFEPSDDDPDFLKQPNRQGVAVFYLIQEKYSKTPSVGLTLVFPKNKIPKKIQYAAIKPDDPSIVINA